MKKLGRLATLLLAVAVAFGLSACKEEENGPAPVVVDDLANSKTNALDALGKVVASVKSASFVSAEDAAKVDLLHNTAKAYVEGSKNISGVKDALEAFNAELYQLVKGFAQVNLDAAFDAIDRGSYNDDDLALLDQVEAYGDLFVNNASSVEAIIDAVSVTKNQLQNTLGSFKKYASGVYSFVALSYEERTEILAMLEAYAYEHFLTGFTFVDDGGYSLYSTTVVRGVDTYVPGYGWATLSDGEIVAPLTGTGVKPEYNMYYHTFQTEDPGHINYADDDGSVVGDLVSYVSSSYWGTRLNETNDGYEWFSETAKEKPVAVNANANTGLATKYEWKMRSDLTYATNSKNATLSKYNGRAVAMEDFITPYQMYYTKALGWERSAENLDGAGSIKGSADYYKASANGFNAAAWENVGIKIEERDGEWVMSVEFNTPCTPFYAMYYMNNNMFSPVPLEFINELGALNGGDEETVFVKGCEIFGKTNADLGLTPVDTYLSCGVYYIESWVSDQEIVFKRDPNYTACGEGRYKIAGIHFDILPAANDDIEAGWKEFNAGNLSACGVPSTQPQERNRHDDKAYAVYTPGSSTFKLNVNACSPELWEQLFGVNGTITKTPVDKYWSVEPAMSNKNFLLGLSWALDREQLAESLGRGASVNYFGDGYLSDPENGQIYNETEAHQNAMSDVTAGGQYPLGYSLEVAKQYFKDACEAFIANGTYKSGDKITIEIAWQSNSQFTNYGDPIIEMWQNAFNEVGAAYGLTLEVSNWAGAVWSDVYYKKMMVGQFDIGFGSINGNSLNPLNFLEVLKSDNSSGFTLNWGADTSEVNLEYKGVLWSFDSLWQAADTGGYFSQGVFTKAYNPDMKLNAAGDDYAQDAYTENEDGTVTLKLNTNPLLGIDGLEVDVYKVAVSGYLNASQDYVEFTCEFEYDAETGDLVAVMDKEAVDTLFAANNLYWLSGYGFHYFMIDITFLNTYNEVPCLETFTVEFAPEWMPVVAE